MSTVNTPTEQISIDLSPLQLKEVKALLAKYLPNTPVWAYGSRVRWSARPNSDLDIVAFASPAQAKQVSLLREAFEESNLPFTVDFFVWDTVPEKFRDNIQREYIVLQSGEATKKIKGGGWPVLALEEIAEVIDSRHKTPKYSDDGLPMVRVVDVKGGLLQLDDTKNVSPEVYKDFSKGRDPQLWDLVISRVGSYGNVAYINSLDKFCLGQNTALISPHNKDRFLYYALLSPQVKLQIEQMVVGAVQKTISLKTIKSLLIPNPPKQERYDIDFLLSALDNKIQLNHQTNQTLEKIAQALFKSWFVDFDPVIDNTLAAGKPIPDELQDRAQSRQQQLARPDHKPLPDDIRQLFPSEFELTEELGWVPKHWEAGATENIAFTNPVSWSKKTAPEQVEYVDLANAKNGYIQDTISYSFEDAPSRARRKLDKGDTIIGLVRPGNRSFAYIQQSGLTGSTGFAVLKPRSDSVRAYLYFHLTRNDVINEFARLADGAAYPAIRPEVVSTFACLLPPDSVLSLYQNKVEGFLGKMAVSSLENRQLEKIRETLLPKLISGELRLPSDALADTTPQAATAKV